VAIDTSSFSKDGQAVL